MSPNWPFGSLNTVVFGLVPVIPDSHISNKLRASAQEGISEIIIPGIELLQGEKRQKLFFFTLKLLISVAFRSHWPERVLLLHLGMLLRAFILRFVI